MNIKVPYENHDRIMTSGRKFGYINSVSGTVDANSNVNHLVYDTSDVTRIRPKDIKGFESIEVANYKDMTLNPPYKIGQSVLYQNSSYGEVGILARGVIAEIEFCIGVGFSIYWYRLENRKQVDRYTIYLDKNDFINRTKPKKDIELKENQRYIFTEYSMQQNTIEVVTIETLTDTHCKILEGYERGAKLRRSRLYRTKEKFHNKFLAQV